MEFLIATDETSILAQVDESVRDSSPEHLATRWAWSSSLTCAGVTTRIGRLALNVRTRTLFVVKRAETNLIGGDKDYEGSEAARF